MNYYLSRLGRTRFGKHGMPVISCLAIGGYLATHTMGHNLIRKLFVADGPDRKPAQISDYLRDMIVEVFSDVEKGGFHVDVLKLKSFNFPKPTIRWFVSSTLDPICYGMTDFATGISIGVPISYNYLEPDDIPDEVFEIKKMVLFRSFQETESEDPKLTEEESAIVRREKEPTVTVRRIDKNSQEGKDFIDSLLLSENAKKFSLARELYVGDSYRPLLQAANLALVTMGANATSRAYVKYLKLKERHITHRMPGYMLAGILFIGLYTTLAQGIDEFIDKKACSRAKELGDDYASGAEEYFRKQAVRAEILGIKKNKFV